MCFGSDDNSAEPIVKIAAYRKIGNIRNPILLFVWLTIHILWNLSDYKFDQFLFLSQNLMFKST